MDEMDNLALQLKETISEPIAVIKSGRAPVPFFFAFEPSAKYPDRLQAFAGLMGGSALIRMFAAMNVIGTRKSLEQTKAYTIKNPEEYVAAFNEKTEATIKAMTVGPLATMYRQADGGSTQKGEQLLKRSELHDFVLPRIFGGLAQISKKHMGDLDDVLTRFVASLKSFKVTPTSDQPQLKHVVLINYIKTTDITGDGSLFVTEAYTRMVILTIKAEDWSLALQKPSKLNPLKKDERINFNMTVTIVDYKFDEARYQANKPKFEQVLKTMVDSEPELKKITGSGGLGAYGWKTCTVWPAFETDEEDKESK